MNRTLIWTVLSIGLLFAVSIIGYIYMPAYWMNDIQRVIGVPLLIVIVWYFAIRLGQFGSLRMV